MKVSESNAGPPGFGGAYGATESLHATCRGSHWSSGQKTGCGSLKGRCWKPVTRLNTSYPHSRWKFIPSYTSVTKPAFLRMKAVATPGGDTQRESLPSRSYVNR